MEHTNGRVDRRMTNKMYISCRVAVRAFNILQDNQTMKRYCFFNIKNNIRHVYANNWQSFGKHIWHIQIL